MVISVFDEEQAALLAEMHLEIQILITIFILAVVLGLYALLFRTAIVEARRQVSKTKSFVAMIPVHVLTREETETIMHFFLPNGFDEDIAEAGGPASG